MAYRILLALALLSVALLAGCATASVDDDNASSRPWNTPKSWENGLPSSMTQGR